MCCRCCSVTQQKCWVFSFGTTFLIIGLLLSIWGPTWIWNVIYKQLPLTPTSRTYDKWANMPVTVYAYMYLFNWTNADQAHLGVLPHFEELGPYVYKEVKTKEDLIWHENKTLTFFGRRTWYFVSELSGGFEDDLVTCPHLPTLAATAIKRDASKMFKFIFNNLINSNGGALYQTHTASEWIFDSFYDEFLDFGMKFNDEIKSNRFAYFLERNGSKEFEGTFTIHTGLGDLRQMGDLKFWRGMNHTGYFEGDCGRINGSTADLWVPNRNLDELITLYIMDTCRIINLAPTGEWVTIQDVKGMKYETTQETFDNGDLNPDMKCYCPKELQPDNCPKSGATHLGGCAQGAPMYLSNPHFLNADESYRKNTTGLNPDYDKHNFYIVMEPKLGIPLQVNANIQVSFHVRRDDNFTVLKNITDFYAPLFVIASKAIVDEELSKEIRLVLNLPDIVRYVGIGLACFGFILLLTGIILTVKKSWYNQKS